VTFQTPAVSDALASGGQGDIAAESPIWSTSQSPGAQAAAGRAMASPFPLSSLSLVYWGLTRPTATSASTAPPETRPFTGRSPGRSISTAQGRLIASETYRRAFHVTDAGADGVDVAQPIRSTLESTTSVKA
jgi:hypothetical protein